MLNALQRGTEGEQRIADWLTKHPDDLGLRAMLAENLIKRGQYKAAAGHYLTLNKQKPGSLLVLNNLAWALFESGDPRALATAEQARTLSPENPAVQDTLGWILVNQGQAKRGLELLRKALSKSPSDGDIHYHLAAAYARSGDKRAARIELEQLLQSDLVFSNRAKARALLNDFRSGTQ
jgi:Flp pilus assembly protein TadD